MTLKELAERLSCRLEGDGDLEVVRVAGVEQAEPGDLTFFANPKYAHALRRTRATAVLLSDDAPAAPCAMLRTAHPYLAFAGALDLFNPPSRTAAGVDPTAVIAADASVSPDASIGPLVSVGSGASIGARTVVYPGVVVGAGARIGDDCVVHARVSIREGEQHVFSAATQQRISAAVETDASRKLA